MRRAILSAVLVLAAAATSGCDGAPTTAVAEPASVTGSAPIGGIRLLFR